MPITGTDIAQFFSGAVYSRAEEIVLTPYTTPTILWTILPLVITTFMIGLYFGRYKTEELGWNTAFGNTISLLWVTTALIRFLYEEYGSWVFLTWDPAGHTPKVIIIGLLTLWAFILAICNFFHALPKWLSFLFSSAVPVNITALLFIIIVIGKIHVDAATWTAAVLLFVLAAIAYSIVEAIIMPSQEAKKYIEDYKHHAEELKEEREQRIRKSVHLIKERIVAQYRATLSHIRGSFGIKNK